MSILLISGHGAGDYGATAKIGTTVYKEAIETINVVNSVKKILSAYANVEAYPEERNAYKDLMEGNLKVDFKKYDYVLEVHFNACVNDLIGDGKTTGTEIFVPIGGDKKLAQEILNNIVKVGFKNRGIKEYNWSVIYKAKKVGIKAALVEVCFIDDKDDVTLYKNKEKDIAEGIANAFINQYKLKKEGGEEKLKKSKIKIIIEDKEVKEGNIEVIESENYNYMKAREIGEALGYDVSYDGQRKAVVFKRRQSL